MKKLAILFVLIVIVLALLPAHQSPTVRANNQPMVEQVKVIQSSSAVMLENTYNTFMKDNLGKITLIERPRIFNDSANFTMFIFYKAPFKKE
jgi:hypothetical protein